MLIPEYSTQFSKDLKKAQKRGKDIAKLKAVMGLLVNEAHLPPQNKEHHLKGSYYGFLECHIEPDWLIIYKICKPYIVFDRTGTHSDLF